MQYKVFQYPLPTDPDLPELNAFLACHRIATVRQEVVNSGSTPLLIFVVEVPSLATVVMQNNAKTDYREQLSAAEFSVFSQLRDLRKQIANEEGVPVYAVFTNAQLAQIVQQRLMTAAQFATVDGIGKARLEKYGSQLVALMREAFGNSTELTNSQENK